MCRTNSVERTAYSVDKLNVRKEKTAFCSSSSVFCFLSSVLCLLPSLFCLLSFVFCLLFSVFSYLSSDCFAEDRITYDDGKRRDPFLALVTPDGRLLNFEPVNSEAKIILEGIFYDENGRSYAIINAEVVSVGDYIFGHAVFKIEENKVTLLKDNKAVEYILEKDETYTTK
ncbi:MAG: hypothetical protein ABIC18_02205 [Candidatus Omnitrophota bacterium]